MATRRQPRIALAPQRSGIGKAPAVKPRYGERKAAREAARAPLLAQLAGFIDSPESYEQRELARLTDWSARMRSERALDWLRVLRWRRTASPSMRERFAEHWHKLPHSPEYALDLIHRLRHEMD